MAGKKDYSVVSVITNLTKPEASEIKSRLLDSSKRIAPKGNHFASTGDGSNVAKAVSRYEAKRITKK